MTGHANADANAPAHELAWWYADHSDRPGARKVWWRGKRAPADDPLGRIVMAEAARLHAAGLVKLDVTGQAGTAQRAHVIEVV